MNGLAERATAFRLAVLQAPDDEGPANWWADAIQESGACPDRPGCLLRIARACPEADGPRLAWARCGGDDFYDYVKMDCLDHAARQFPCRCGPAGQTPCERCRRCRAVMCCASELLVPVRHLYADAFVAPASTGTWAVYRWFTTAFCPTLKVRRGLVEEVSGTLDDFLGAAADLAEHAHVRRVRLTDVLPCKYGGGLCALWRGTPNLPGDGMVPPEIFDLLDGLLIDTEQGRGAVYNRRSDAAAALSAACVRYCRDRECLT